MMLRCSPVGVNGLAGQYPVDPIARPTGQSIDQVQRTVEVPIERPRPSQPLQILIKVSDPCFAILNLLL